MILLMVYVGLKLQMSKKANFGYKEVNSLLFVCLIFPEVGNKYIEEI